MVNSRLTEALELLAASGSGSGGLGVESGMDNDIPNLNTGTPWSEWDDRDIRWGLDNGRSIEETADFLCRTPTEIHQRIHEIEEADRIGDPSLLYDGRTHKERIALETYRDARAALALIREAVEDCAPPGSVLRADYLTAEFTVEAEALVRGIYAINGRSRRLRKRGRTSRPD
jgi:hypothetical protein